MRQSDLPSPNIGARGMQLRKQMANTISYVAVTAAAYPGGKHPNAAGLMAFLNAAITALGENPTLPPDPVAAWYDTWTFSRASAKRAQNYDGSVVNFAAGEKAVTDLGLSLERTTTNIIPSPLDLSAWVNQNGTITSVGAGVWQYMPNTTAGAHGCDTQNLSVTSGNTNGAYVEVKPNGARYVQLVFSSFGFGSTHYVNFDLLLGVKGTVGAGLIDSRIVPLPDGWFRLYLSAQATATLANSVFFWRVVDSLTAARNLSWTPAGTEGLLFRGAQMASNSYPTSLIEGVRAADSLTRVTPAANGDLAFYFDAVILPCYPINTILFEWGNAASAPTQYVRVKADPNGIVFLTVNTGSGETTVITEANNTVYAPRRVRVAVKRTSTSWAMVVNGKTANGGVTGGVPTGLTHMRLGTDNGGGTGNSSPVYVKDFVLFEANPLVAEMRVLTDLPALTAPTVVPHASATVKETTVAYQGIPGMWQTAAGRTWAAWDRRYQMDSSYGERPGMNLVLAYSDNNTTWTTVGYLVPNYYDAWVDQVHIWEATDGSLWVIYTLVGGGIIHDGRYGVWVAKINNHATSPSFGTQKRICDGIAMKPFYAGGKWYLNVDVWPDEITPVHADVTKGRFIYEIDVANVAVTLRATVPQDSVAADRTYDETSCVELSNGNIVARWRSKSGAKQATLTGGIGGTWGGQSAVSGTNSDSRACLYKGPGGAIVWAYNASAVGSRTNLTIRVSTDDLATEPYSFLIDSRTNVSYPDVFVDQTTGAIKVIYDRERGATTGSGAREVILAHGFTVADIIAGTAVATLSVISDGSPA